MPCIDVHIQDITKSCPSATVTRAGGDLSAGVFRAAPQMVVTGTAIMERFNADISRVNGCVIANVADTVKHLNVRCGIVCSVGVAAYLKVEPETIWLMPSNDFSQDVVVYANVTWRIE